MSNTLIIILLSAIFLVSMFTLLILTRKTTAGSDVSGKTAAEILRIETAVRDEFSRNRQELSNSLKESRSELGANQDALRRETESGLEKIRGAIEKSIDTIRQENAKKLEEMRVTVDEKLHTTLEKRLGESFKQVSERLEQVYKGLGEMQNIAAGVGDLKKVLSNVKTRGILGEIQLGAILEDILAPEQYEKNVVVKKGSRENVEFAVKMPGRDSAGDCVYLPIDSKFPAETYHALLDAYDSGDTERAKAAIKSVESEIKRCAKEIREKYIDPPHSTEYGILFLPFEGLFAEVVRQTVLIETLHREYRVVVAGPTTLAALLNSIQMGFRTLALEKRSSEVWGILGAVKTEFDKFGDVLKKAQEKITKAGEDIDTLVGARTRQIQSKLRSIETLPADKEVLKISGETE